MKSIEFYNHHHEAYIKKTYGLDMSASYAFFLEHLKPQGHLLDLGCGCGRDSEYFFDLGYKVTSVDGSKALIDHCRSYLQTNLIHDFFETFQTQDRFDGIWASASLLHVARHDLKAIVEKYIHFLKPGGIFYMSFKNFNEDFYLDGRYFTCFNPEQFQDFLEDLCHVDILAIRENQSIQTDNMRWVSTILQKR